MKKFDIDKIAEAIEADAGAELEGLRESLKEMHEGRKGREYTSDQLRLITMRKRLQVTQDAFARVLDTPVGTYRDWEQGRFPVPGPVRILLEMAEKRPDTVIPELLDRAASGSDIA